MKYYIYYYFSAFDCFTYTVDKSEITERFGEEPDGGKELDEWHDEIQEYYEDAARDEAKRISDENESALEDLKDSYMRSV